MWQLNYYRVQTQVPGDFRSTNNRETEELSARPGKLRGSYSAQRIVMAVIIGRASTHEGIM
jgi:hypothetical protein